MSDKISSNRQKKEKIIAKLSDKVSRAKGMIFTNYQGMTHIQLEHLKKAVKAVDAEFTVTKNTLLKRALENGKCPAKQDPALREKLEIGNSLQGPTATLFTYADITAPLKELAKIIKLLNLPKIKFGILEGQALNSDQVLKLASLPSREVLISQLIGQMKAPLFGLHRSLSWNIQKLVLTLKAIEKTKQG